MKTLKSLVAVALFAGVCIPLATFAEDAKQADAAKPYPLKTCIVSGEKLGEMGKPYTLVHEGREIKLCCKGCLKDFQKDPAKYLKKLDAAEKAAKK